MIDIKLKEKQDLEGTTMIEGFSGGMGLVGTIAANYIVEKENMNLIGHVNSDKFPPVTLINDGKPYPPVRLYKHPKKDICVLIGELIVPSEVTQDLSEEILEFAGKKEIKKIISIGGMRRTTGKKGKQKLYGIASSDKQKEQLENLDIELIEEGVAMGVSGIMLAKATERNYPAMSILAESRKNLPDPEAAAEIVEKINQMFDTKIETDELKEQAKDIEQKTQKFMKRIKKARKKYQESEKEPISSMYR